MRSRLTSLLAVSLTALGCSFPYDQLERVDAPIPDAPIIGCHIIDQTGCSSGSCQADVDATGFIETLCHPAGSSNAGGYCSDHSFCGNTLACWDDRDGSGDGHCYEVCFQIGDCNVGTHCDATGFTASYAGRTAYRCVPDSP